MRFLYFIALILFIRPAFSQEIGLRTVKTHPDFTYENLEYWERDSVYLGLPFVKNSTYQIHFRYYLNNHLIDLYSEDGVEFSGIITTRTTEVIHKKSDWGQISVPEKIFFKQIKIEASLATNIALLIIESGQPKALTDALIEGWKFNFFDCTSIKIHFKFGESFRPQSYTCPWGQDSTLSEVKTLLSNYRILNEKLELGKVSEDFRSLLPRGKFYSYEDSYLTFYRLSESEFDAWEKDTPRREYLDLVKDTTISYLKNYMLDQPKQSFNTDCFEIFYLGIAKNGHLNFISVADYDKPKLRDGIDFFRERRRVKTCKRSLTKIFQNIDLGFLELEYEVMRIVSFTIDEKISVR